LFVLVLAGCTATMTEELLDAFAGSFGDTIVVPASDASPPAIKLSIPDLGIVLHPGDADATIDVSGMNINGVFIVAEAEDAQGVKSVCLQSGFVRSCSGGGIGSTSQSLSSAQCDESTAAPGGTATTRRWLPKYVDYDVVSACGDGQEGGTTLSFFATATNFAGQIVSSPSVAFVNHD